MGKTKTHRIDYEGYAKDLMKYMAENGLKCKPFPTIHVSNKKQGGLFISTGHYDPESKSITIYVNGRHPKDVLRTLAHEMIHHSQNLEGRLVGYNGTRTSDDDVLTELESEAYMRGNLLFRNWTEGKTKTEKPNKSFSKHMKKKIKITEQDLNRLVNECVKKVLNEQDDNRYYGQPEKITNNPLFTGRAIKRHLQDMEPGARHDFDNPDEFSNTLNNKRHGTQDVKGGVDYVNSIWDSIVHDINNLNNGGIGMELGTVCHKLRQNGYNLPDKIEREGERMYDDFIRNLVKIITEKRTNNVFRDALAENKAAVRDFNDKVEKYNSNLMTNRAYNKDYYNLHNASGRIIKAFEYFYSPLDKILSAVFNGLGRVPNTGRSEQLERVYDTLNRIRMNAKELYDRTFDYQDYGKMRQQQ